MLRSLGAALLLCCCVSTAHAQYVITDLGVLTGTASIGFDVNFSGQVIGSITIGSNRLPFRYTAGTGTQYLPTLGGTSGEAYELNTAGQVVGWSHVPGDTSYHAVLWSSTNQIQDLGAPLGGTYSMAQTINASGVVAGWSSTVGNGSARGVVWSSGSFTDLGTLGGVSSNALSINASGQVVGRSNVMGGAEHAFLYDEDEPVEMIDLGTLGGSNNFSIATGINDAGLITGGSYNASNQYRAFLYDSESLTPTMQDLGTLGGSTSEAFGINNLGEVAGLARDSNEQPRAFVYRGGTMIDLNTQIAGGSGWVLTHAWQVSDSGFVTGMGTINGQQHAFLLTPVPEPGVWALLGLAAGAALVWQRRRRAA